MCTGFLKVMMFIFNGAIFLCGIAGLAVGIWVVVDSDSLLGLFDFVENAPTEIFQVVVIGYVLIGVGALLLIVGFLGCCGAVKESRCMLLTFFSIVLIIFLVEVAGAILLFAFTDVVDEMFEELEGDVKDAIQRKYGEDNDMTTLWNTTMEEFKCCGYKNYTDFDGSPFNVLTRGYPSPCCSTPGIPCNESGAHMANVDGCFTKLVKFLEDNSFIIAGVALGIAAIEIAAMVVSMVLYCNAGRKSR
ncbi:PREDICTED: tetraspanin-1-like [Cyprinodon variegatus]|uniref:Tetraspanin n=1 Tax=Cyprinodon variegatus TaxID=28743 RepID=A0A3Q2CCJ2_CYPVA|nr:PREDICTED: tetraspanin-1-like [Cyprinodon variegatus]